MKPQPGTAPNIIDNSEQVVLNLIQLLLQRESFMQAVLTSKTLYDDLELIYSVSSLTET